MSGTFVFYSWDIMEPIAYTMFLGNFTVGFFFYALLNKDMQLGTLKEILATRSARRLYRKRGISQDQIDKLEEEIKDIRSVLNKSIY